MGQRWDVVLKRRFAAEIDRRVQCGRVESTDPMSVGELLGMDALEVAGMVASLTGEGFVELLGKPDYLVDPYTGGELELTEAGKRFARGLD